MVQIDLGDFSLNVPLKQRMHVREFLAIADRLTALQGPSSAAHPQYIPEERYTPPSPSQPAPAAIHAAYPEQEEEFYLDKRDELQHMLQQMRMQNKRLEQHDELIVQMLEYMQSMTEHLKRR